MKALISIYMMRFKLVLNYRASAIAGMFTQFFFGFVMVMIFLAFYESSDNTELPMTLKQTITYIWLGQALLGLIPWNGDRDIQTMIRNGDFAYELVRPLDTYNYWLYRIIAQRIASTLLRGIPLIIVALIFIPGELRVMLPSTLSNFLMFMLTIITSIVLGGAISNIITISVLYTIGDGIERLMPALVTIFSGLIIPLSFFPDWTQPILRILPFSSLVDSPYKFYLGIYGLKELPLIFLHQFLWTLTLMFLGRFMIYKARKRIIVQGG